MKLLQKTSRLYLLMASILVVLAGVLLFILLNQFVKEEIREQLLLDKEQIIQKLKKGEEVSSISPIIEINPLSDTPKDTLFFKTVSLFDPIEQEEEPYIELEAITTIDSTSYQIKLRQLALEREDFLSIIGIALVGVLVLLLVGLVGINRRISKKLWQPFYSNLTRLKNFTITDQKILDLQPSNIDEFQELNEVLASLTRKVQTDYHTLKAFSENASHEMQTPLAIIQAKLDEILQTPQLTNEQALLVQSATNALQRLKRLNKTLLLLTKIENQQFEKVEPVRLDQMIQNQLELFADFIEAKQLKVEMKAEKEVAIKANPHLAELLISNLLRNAVRHNQGNGFIRIMLSEYHLLISNSGKTTNITAEQFFERFKKGTDDSNSLGLGLAIVKSICEQYGWPIQYKIEKQEHQIEIRFQHGEM